jgi:hypothetical protein
MSAFSFATSSSSSTRNRSPLSSSAMRYWYGAHAGSVRGADVAHDEIATATPSRSPITPSQIITGTTVSCLTGAASSPL